MINDFCIGIFYILDKFLTLFHVDELLEVFENVFDNFGSYILTFKTYLSYIYFFIDKNLFITIVTLSISVLVVRIGFAVIQLIYP